MLNEVLGVAARFQQLLTRKFGILGGAPSPQLTPEITPEWSLNATEPEDRILINVLLGAGTLSVAAVAAQKGIARLSNPAGSNVTIVLERAIFCAVGAASSFWGSLRKGNVLANLPSPNAIGQRDSRVGTDAGGAFTKASTGQLSSADTSTIAGSVRELFDIHLPADIMGEYRDAVMIGPGWCFEVLNNTANQSFVISCAWREVPLAPGEVGPF